LQHNLRARQPTSSSGQLAITQLSPVPVLVTFTE
jgi:hypothetical protein